MDFAAKQRQIAPTLLAEAPEAVTGRSDEQVAVCVEDAAPFPLHAGAPAPLLAGRYRVDWVLAEGGMGIVYRGWHVALDQPIAIKMIRGEYSNNSEAAERFLREAQAMALLRGKHTPHVMDVARAEDGTPFMVLEFLEGKDLRQLMSEQAPLATKRVVQWVLQACEAVAEAHSQGLIHRDLKPDNLFLSVEPDGSEVVKVIDFGISKSLVKKSKFKTRSESCLGSPQYMSPEQIRSPRLIDARTDVWSLGVVLYELLTGYAPFLGTTLPAVCSAVLKLEPTNPCRLRKDIPEGLGAIIMRCLTKSVDDRVQSVTQLIQELCPYAREEPSTNESAASGVRVTGAVRVQNGDGTRGPSEPESEAPSMPRSFPFGAVSLVVAGGLVCFAAAAAGTGRITLPLAISEAMGGAFASDQPSDASANVQRTRGQSSNAADPRPVAPAIAAVSPLPVPVIEVDELSQAATAMVAKKPRAAKKPGKRATRRSKTLVSSGATWRDAKPESQLMEERYALTYEPADAPPARTSLRELKSSSKAATNSQQLGKTLER